MKSYYRILNDTDNNFISDTAYIQVNCTGQTIYQQEINASSTRHDYYLIYVLRGYIDIKEPVMQRLKAGEMIIFEREKKFEYSKPEGSVLEYYWIHFTGTGANDFLKQCGFSYNSSMTPGYLSEICIKFQKLFDVFLSRSHLFEVESTARFMDVLICMSKCMNNKETWNSRNHKKINHCLTYIHENLSSPLKVAELALKEHMSVSCFREVFRENIGMAPQEYIILSRLNRACELLRVTDLSMKEISYLIGYEDAQYFSRIFKKVYGVSPKRYKSGSQAKPLNLHMAAPINHFVNA